MTALSPGYRATVCSRNSRNSCASSWSFRRQIPSLVTSFKVSRILSPQCFPSVGMIFCCPFRGPDRVRAGSSRIIDSSWCWRECNLSPLPLTSLAWNGLRFGRPTMLGKPPQRRRFGLSARLKTISLCPPRMIRGPVFNFVRDGLGAVAAQGPAKFLEFRMIMPFLRGMDIFPRIC